MRIRQSLLNVATMVLFLAVTMAVALFASPWLKTWLGHARFGAFRVVVDCQGYLTLLELGLGGALAPLLARALGHGDERALEQMLATGVRAYLAITLLTLAAGLALTPLIPRFAAQLAPAAVVDLRRAWVIGLIGFLPLSLVPFRALVEARQQGYRVNLLLVGQSLLITAASLMLARSGWGITGQALAGALGTWAFYLVLTFTVSRARPGLLWAVLTVPAEPLTRRTLWALSLPTLLNNLSGRISLMTDHLVIGAMLGAALVTTLFFTQRLAVLAQLVLQGIGSAVWASFAEIHARGEHALFNRRLVELSRLLAILSVAALGPIVAYDRWFVALWLGPDFAYGGDLVIITAAFNTFLLGQLTLWSWCFGATGQIQRVVRVSVVASAINLAASLILTRTIGLAGPLLGTTFASVAVGAWALPWLLKGTFGVPIAALARATALPLCWGLLSPPPSGGSRGPPPLRLVRPDRRGGAGRAGPLAVSRCHRTGEPRRAGALAAPAPGPPGKARQPPPRQHSPLPEPNRPLEFWASLRSDALAHIPEEHRKAGRGARPSLLAAAIMSSGFHVMLSYRMSHARAPVAGPLGRLLAGVLFRWNRHFYGVSIAPTARLHGGLILPHPQGIVIGAGVVVGPRAWIFQNVTIGGTPGKLGVPAIGADARIYCGAVVVGPIELGDNVVIGANAVVQRDVPERTLVRSPQAEFAPLPARYEVE